MKTRKITLQLIALLFVYTTNLTAQVTPGAGNIIYVKSGAMGKGTSWADALGELADALKYAKQIENTLSADKPLQIWVAAGTYYPFYDPSDDNFGNTPIDDPRLASFRLLNNVHVYGGFAGSETELNARNWETNQTILSGDIGTLNDDADNIYQIVVSAGTSANPITNNTKLDGFTIKGGNGNKSVSRIINEVSFSVRSGAGMYNQYSSPSLTNITFIGNNSSNGGGLSNYDSYSPTLVNVNFLGNTGINGGGMYNNRSPSPLMINVKISENEAQLGGGI